MPRFAANLTMLFKEVAFPDRFAEASKAGFRGVECLFPYEFPADALAKRLHRIAVPSSGQRILLSAIYSLPPEPATRTASP